MLEYKLGHRHPWSTLKKAIRMYKSRYTYRQVSAKLLEQGIDVSHKTIHEWVKKFKKEYNLIQKNVKNLKKR